MNARAVAETPPVISSMTPRSQVIMDTGNEFSQKHDSLNARNTY